MPLPRLALATLGAALFCLLVLLNVGGYRYGASDQAFYIPALLLHIDPNLFPRDAGLLAAQDRLLLFDDAFGLLTRLTGWSIPNVFFAVYLAGLLLFFVASVMIGAALYRSPWTTAALAAALTLRHRITATAVNTHEAYLHPRMLAFAVGLAAIAALLRGRTRAALLLAGLAALCHPTTALWFIISIGVAVAICDVQLRRGLVVLAPLMLAGAAALLAGPFRDQLIVMDEPWLDLLASRDYLFPHEWPGSAWAVNLGCAVITAIGYRLRRSAGLTTRPETGLIAGCAALFLVFCASVPLTTMRLALAVQLQANRVFWMLDVMASIYVIWMLAEGPWSRTAVARPARPAVLAAVLAIAATARGAYVMLVEHAGSPVVRTGLPDDDWRRVMAWIVETPIDAHVLADPGHAWRYGSSVRVAGRRDVYLEEVKDVAIAMYSRPVAQRVLRRIRDLPEFSSLSAAEARHLASVYDLDYLVTEQALDLPRVFASGRFSVYALSEQP